MFPTTPKILLTSSGLKTLVRTVRDLHWRASVRAEMLRHKQEDPYVRKIEAIHSLLKIPSDYASSRGLALQRECTTLVAVKDGDLEGGTVEMDKTSYEAFSAMRDAAAKDGVVLTIRWAYRSVDDQSRYLRDRLRWGNRMIELLKYVAAPGYSEHHTGRAVDLCTPDVNMPFEKTSAYAWLIANAESFNFIMSYPQDNRNGIIFEPWHWFYRG